MTARDEIRRRSGDDVAAAARGLGLEASKTSRKHWICPQHGGSSLSLTVGPDGSMRCRCFGCDLSGDIYTLAAAIEGLELPRDFREVHAHLAEILGVALDAPTPGASRYVPRERTPAPPPPAPVYPPAGEAEEMWYGAAAVTDNAVAAAYLKSRELDPSMMWPRGLARVLTASTARFGWATFRGLSWFDAGYTIVVPTYDHTGALRGLRAWNPRAKRLAPTGCNVAGLIMACSPFGVAMLEGTHRPDRVVIAEGEPDFLTWATHGKLLDERRWVTLGIVNGAWTQALADRIPDGAEVTVWTDHDDQGDRYAAQIAATLAHRVRLQRAVTPEQCA